MPEEEQTIYRVGHALYVPLGRHHIEIQSGRKGWGLLHYDRSHWGKEST